LSTGQKLLQDLIETHSLFSETKTKKDRPRTNKQNFSITVTAVRLRNA